MRAVLLAASLIGVILAGCFDEDETTDETYDVAMEAVDAAAVLSELEEFSTTYPERADNTDAHLGARDWLANHFETSGLEVWRQSFIDGEDNPLEQENIVGIHWGERTDEWIIVGAHYDMASKECGLVGMCVLRPFSQGAYDDGSGTLMTMHLARAVANLDTYYTVAFVAFDGEERGLHGSKAFAEALTDGATPWGHILMRGMLDLDMIGLNWPGVQAPIYFDENSPQLEATVEEARLAMEMPEDMIKYQGIELGRSDYHWFIELGVPTGFLISDFEEWEVPESGVIVEAPGLPAGLGAYPFWHLEDTYETMLLMAGSEADLQAGFQTALDLSVAVLETMLNPDIGLEVEGA